MGLTKQEKEYAGMIQRFKQKFKSFKDLKPYLGIQPAYCISTIYKRCLDKREIHKTLDEIQKENPKHTWLIHKIRKQIKGKYKPLTKEG